MKKCQHCAKQATTHITDIAEDGSYQEFHFCDDCGQVWINSAGSPGSPGGPGDAAGGSALTGETPAEAAESILDQLEDLPVSADATSDADLACGNCRLTFKQFREQGRLGCPYCYTEFRERLVPILGKLHLAERHTGKRPATSGDDRQKLNRVFELRSQMQEAIEEENYEEAQRLKLEIEDLS